MNATDIIARLKVMEPELRRAGLGALYLFGSRARGDHRPDSDVDLLFEVSAEADSRFNFLDQATVINLLADRLGTHVDLVERRALLSPLPRACRARPGACVRMIATLDRLRLHPAD